VVSKNQAIAVRSKLAALGVTRCNEICWLRDGDHSMIFLKEYSGRISKDAVLPSLKGILVHLSKIRRAS